MGGSIIHYRADIDGLRALAVVPIVLFHAGVPFFDGGFVGVDIFFTISGYLIASIIHDDLARGTFSLSRFYDRRVRRILPALLLVLITTTAAAALILMPLDFAAYGKSLVATLLFSSNILFWRETGYFNPEAFTKPLLHTWSLAVEEQYYIVFPILLALCFRRFAAFWVPIAAIGALSFVLSVYATIAMPAASFFLVPTRAWELVLGATLALAPFARPTGWAAQGLGLAGAALIGTAVFTFTEQTPFPGLAALLPCGGAALLILVGQSSPATYRLLALSPVRGIGRISYSLYLWHWPVIVLYRYYRGGAELAPFETSVLLAAMLGLSVVSWRFVETPFRTRAILPQSPALFRSAFAASACLTLVGGAIFATTGIPQRFGPDVVRIDLAARDQQPMACHNKPPLDVAAGRVCVIGAPGKEPRLVYWGDSHAWALQSAASSALAKAGEAALAVTWGGCPPLFGLRRENFDGPCHEVGDAVRTLVETRGIKSMVLVATWPSYFKLPMVGDDSRRGEAAVERAFADDAAYYQAQGVRVLIVDNLPGARASVPRVMAQKRAYGLDFENRLTMAEHQAKNRAYEAAAHGLGFIRVGLAEHLCRAGYCAVAEDGYPLYSDNNHVARSRSDFAGLTLLDGIRSLQGR